MLQVRLHLEELTLAAPSSSQWRFERLLLSHHPPCSHYSQHVVVIRGVALCLGCLVTYPVALMALALALVLGLGGELFALSLPLLLLERGAAYARTRGGRALAKAAVGVGLGLTAGAIVGLSLPLATRILILAGAYLGALAVATFKAWVLWRHCRRCHEEPLCPLKRFSL